MRATGQTLKRTVAGEEIATFVPSHFRLVTQP